MAAFLASLLAVSAAVTAARAQDAHLPSPGDRIGLRVIAWDSIDQGFEEFDALGGTYDILDDGAVLLPLLGAVEVAGQTTSAISAKLAVMFGERLGLVEAPSISVWVDRYRPVYVLGDVVQRGRYDFEPGLTVVQALALAGGVEVPLLDAPDSGAAAIRTTGKLRALQSSLARLQVRAARLRAEAAGADSFEEPEVRHPNGAAAVAVIVEQERSLFQSRRDTLKRALEGIEDTEELIRTEVSALEEKLEGVTRQVGLVEDSIGDVEALVERGLARSPNLVNLQRTLIELEARQLDTETAIYRALQQLSELEQDRIGIETRHRQEVLRDLQSTETNIEEARIEIDTSRELLVGADLPKGVDPGIGVSIDFRITRDGPEGVEVIKAERSTRLAPNDVLEIDAIVALDIMPN